MNDFIFGFALTALLTKLTKGWNPWLQIQGWKGTRYCLLRRAWKVSALAAALAVSGYAVSAALDWRSSMLDAAADRELLLAMLNGQPAVEKHDDGSADYVHVETKVIRIERIE